mmetsp:Transcript_71258/g.196724  ORF Transcript_71258/g.196724 Transcript_71258/m.196724 type:complete len:915 (+) Transcript_71258:821-3565(+)
MSGTVEEEVLDEEVCSLDLRQIEEDAAMEENDGHFSSKELESDPFHVAIAASFSKAQKMLAETHEKALKLLAKCVEEVHQKEKANKDLRKQVALIGKGSRTNTSLPRSSSGGSRRLERSNSRTGSRIERSSSRHGSRRTQSITAAAGTYLAAKVADFRDRRNVGWLSTSEAGTGLSGAASASDLEAFSPPKDDVAPEAPVENAPSMKLPGFVQEQSEMGDEHLPVQPERSQRSQRSPSPGSLPPGPSCPSSPALAPELPSCLQRRLSISSVHSKASSGLNRFELLPAWSREPKNRKGKKRAAVSRSLSRGMSSESLASTSSAFSMDSSMSNTSRCARCSRKFVLDPNATVRATWDVMSIFLVVYDMVMIPLQLFELPETLISDMLSWTTRLFWTWDLVMSFCTGYVRKDGIIENRLWKIAKSYICSWFLIDILIVGIDWVEVLWADGSFLGFARAGKASRTFRIIRMVRLLRLARVRNVFNMMTDRIQSEQLIIVAGIINIMLVIMGLGHVIACVWYGIAAEALAGDSDPAECGNVDSSIVPPPSAHCTWVRRYGYVDAPLELKYSTALHWSLLQFAGGTDEIVPQNTGERIYAVAVFLLAFVMAAVFVGRLTSSMTQLHMLSKKDVEKFQVLKRYLNKNEISSALTMRVMHNAQHALQETQRFMEENRVELLGMISEPLRVELHFELYAPVVSVHPFFRCFTEACPQVMKKVCHAAMSQLLVSNGDVVFMLGEVPSPPQMFIVCSGELSYHYVTGAVAYVEAGQWISEATLWTSWTHQGMLKAASDCRLCLLDAQKFLEFAETFDHDFDLRSYARTFVECMNNGGIDVSDLPFNEDAEVLMEAIALLEGSKNEMILRGMAAEASTPAMKRQSTEMSLFSGNTVFAEDVSAAKKQSVLMVTPTDQEGKKKWLFW